MSFLYPSRISGTHSDPGERLYGGGRIQEYTKLDKTLWAGNKFCVLQLTQLETSESADHQVN